MHNHASIDMFGEPVPAETIVNPLDLLDSIVSAAEAVAKAEGGAG